MALDLLFQLAQGGLEDGIGSSHQAPRVLLGELPSAIGLVDLVNAPGDPVARFAVLGCLVWGGVMALLVWRAFRCE